MKSSNYETANIQAMRTMLARDPRASNKNCEDFAIPTRGAKTKIKAKNLMICDAFLLAGGYTGYVVEVNTKYVGFVQGYMTTVRVMNHNGKTFTRVIEADAYVHIVEFPWSRKARRTLSRVPLKYRYTFGKRVTK